MFIIENLSDSISWILYILFLVFATKWFGYVCEKIAMLRIRYNYSHKETMPTLISQTLPEY